jgi:uncharacterized protein
MTELIIKKVDDSAIFTVKVIAGSNSPTRICGLLDGMLKVKVSAAPERGKANKCLIDFLAEKIGIKKNAISIISGQTSPVKHIKVSGISTDSLLKKLNLEQR